MKIEDTIREIAEAGLKDNTFFIVDVTVHLGKQRKITVLLDGDKGVNIDDCSALSRFIGKELEEKDLIDTAFTLDVSSPGLDTPLALPRQYSKNVGRDVKVKLLNGETVSGKLQSADKEKLQLEITRKKEKEELIIQYENIDWTKVQVTF